MSTLEVLFYQQNEKKKKKKKNYIISRLPIVCSNTIIQNENEAILKGLLLVNKLPIIYS
jgi:hypothetical protein